MALDTPDATLLRRYVAERSGAAFGELTDRYLGLVYRAALRQMRGDEHAAADVAQCVFILLARKAPELGNHPCLVGWLHSTTRYVARDHLRAAARRQHYEQDAAVMNTPEPPTPAWETLRPVIDEALGELAEHDRQAVLLRYFAELPFNTIGQRLGIAENAARMRVDRALEKLQARLRTRGITSTGAALGAVFAAEAAAGAVPAGLAGQIVASSVGFATVSGAALTGFMTAGKAITWFSAAVLAVALGTAGYSLRQKHEAEQALAEAKSRESELTQRRMRTAALGRALAADAVKLAPQPMPLQTRTAVDASNQAPGTSAAALNPREQGQRLLAKYPELKAAYIAWQREKLLNQYAGLFRDLHLTPEQVQRFLDIEVTSPSQSTLQMGYGPYGKPVILDVADASKADEIGRLSDLLGREGVRRWAQYSNAKVAQDTVLQLARGLTYSETPLTAEQASALTNALASGLHPPPGTRLSPREIDWEAATSQAEKLLTPEQLPAFVAIRDAALTQEAASRPQTATAKNSASHSGS